MSIKQIKIYSFLALLVFIVGNYSTGHYVNKTYNKSFQSNILTTETFVKKFIDSFLDDKKEEFVSRAKVIFSNDKLLKALEGKDRDKFYELAKPYFDRIQKGNKNFWGMHIVLPNNISFIRVHKPSKEDKLIAKGEKPLIDKVNKTKKVAVGFEDGKFGYFQRTVYPIFSKGGKYLGLVELSVSIDALFNPLKEKLGFDARLVIDNIFKKEYLNNMPLCEIRKWVIYKSTNPKLFNKISQQIREQNNTLDKNHEELHKKFAKVDDKVFKVTKIPLNERSGLTIAYEITDFVNEKNNFENIIWFVTNLITFLSIVVCIVFVRIYIISKKRDEHLLSQGKMAAMGEMIGNIAHQWRQPLSTISTASSGMRMESEFGTLDDNKVRYYTDGIKKSTEYLSETIETFRNFLKEQKDFKEIVIEDRIDRAISIVNVSLKDHHIELKNNINYASKTDMLSVSGEIEQVVINILNNAKDILRERNIEDAWIELNLDKKDDSVLISIEDNGGGIPENIIDKIFEPYFTTKHQSQGTGLGLYMSYKITTESLNGDIYVENTKNGAKFFIELPYDRRKEERNI